jgi:hypothetical protein
MPALSEGVAMRSSMPVLPEFDPVLQPIGHALACEFRVAAEAEPEHVEPEHVEPEHVEPEHVEPEHVEPERVEPEPVANDGAAVELLVRVPASPSGSPVEWFVPHLDGEADDDHELVGADDDHEFEFDYPVRRAS